jgi:cytolysin (calcineurin-like family phosphatase)
MQTLTLSRGPSTDQGTPGTILLNGTQFKTLELKWDNNIPDFSCIPVGAYDAIYGFSDHLNRYTYFLTGTGSRTTVEIHQGNWAGNTRILDAGGKQLYTSDVLGCILIGKSAGALVNKFGNTQTAVLGSVIALNEFESMLNNESFVLRIVNAA